jgi:2-polyprenyl-3-methyl-5-hydroxy-6-metoxy-1,4-benzoquinol methylase
MFEEDYFLTLPHEKRSREWRLFHEEQISQLLKYFDQNETEICICDVGCGLGDFLSACDDAGLSTFGTDVSEYAIGEARKRTRARLMVSDVQAGVPFSQQFDIITCFDVVEHLEGPEAALAAIEHQLKSKGVLLLTTPNVQARFLKRLLRVEEDRTHISEKKKHDWNRILRALNFDVLLAQTIYPVASYKGGIKSLLARALSLVGLGSTLCLLAVKKPAGTNDK